MTTEFYDENHANNTLERMCKHWKNRQLCDVILTAEKDGTEIPAHRFHLSVSSEYFNTMFASSMREAQSENISISEIDGEILQMLVEYFYTGRIEICEDNVEKLLAAAHYFLLDALKSACGKFLADHLQPTNYLKFAAIAKLFNHTELTDKVNDYIRKNFTVIYKTEDFVHLSFEELKNNLLSEDLNVTSEEDVFHSIMLWMKFDLDARDKYKDELLKVVRMPQLEASFLIDYIQPICKSSESLKLYSEAIQWHLLLDRRAMNETNHKQTKRRRIMFEGTEKLIFFMKSDDKINLKCYIPQYDQWFKCLKNLEIDKILSVAIIDENLYIADGTKSIACLNLKTMILTNNAFVMNNCTALTAINNFIYAKAERSNSFQISCHNQTIVKCNVLTQEWKVVFSYLSLGKDFVALSGKIYEAPSFPTGTDKILCYDPEINFTKTIKKSNYTHQNASLIGVNGYLWLIGGKDCKSSFECYDPCRESWSSSRNIFLNETLSTEVFCTSFNDKIIISYNNKVVKGINDEWKQLTTTKYNDEVLGLVSYTGEISLDELVKD